MIEHILYTSFFICFGMQIGSILRDRQYRRSISQKVGQQVSSPWYGPAELTYRLHADQDGTGDMTPPLNIWAPSKRMPFWLEMQYEFQRWKAPRLRRVT